jgi:hypothetical protein
VLRLTPIAVSSFGSYAVILVAFILFQKYARTANKISGKEVEEIVYFER